VVEGVAAPIRARDAATDDGPAPDPKIEPPPSEIVSDAASPVPAVPVRTIGLFSSSVVTAIAAGLSSLTRMPSSPGVGSTRPIFTAPARSTGPLTVASSVPSLTTATRFGIEASTATPTALSGLTKAWPPPV
jgi:hypothetical protein